MREVHWIRMMLSVPVSMLLEFGVNTTMWTYLWTQRLPQLCCLGVLWWLHYTGLADHWYRLDSPGGWGVRLKATNSNHGVTLLVPTLTQKLSRSPSKVVLPAIAERSYFF